MKTNLWVEALLEWYQKSHRFMPWRTNTRPSPYFIWLSEIMLQQTRVDAVIPYFSRFVRRFPTLKDLAVADIQEVLKLWQGLGYYSRARNLHRAACMIQNEFEGNFPRNYEELKKLPGVGDYTAAAVASIAFGQPIPSIDGNVLRVFTRFWAMKTDVRKPKVRKSIFDRLIPIIQSSDPAVFNQSIMELGSLVCRPKRPKCFQCPLKSHCKAFKFNLTEKIPTKTKKSPIPSLKMGVGVVWDHDHFLIYRRDYKQMLGGLWGFPGGPIKEDQEMERLLPSKILEESSLRVKILNPYCTVKHSYSHFKVCLTAFKCELIGSGISVSRKALANPKFEWITADQIERYPFDRATLKVMASVPIFKNLEF